MRNSITRHILLVTLLLPACSSVSRPSDWIVVGRTSAEEIVQQYGEPDLVSSSPEGELATYLPHTKQYAPWPVYIPVAQPAGRGIMTARDQPIEPGLGVKSLSAGARERPDRELRIQYDTNRVVRALLE